METVRITRKRATRGMDAGVAEEAPGDGERGTPARSAVKFVDDRDRPDGDIDKCVDDVPGNLSVL